MRISVFYFAVVSLLLVLLGHAGALSIPEMPGPPYPDKFGNNRWGVKYDPKVHGRDKDAQNPTVSSEYLGAEKEVDVSDEQLPEIIRYRSIGIRPLFPGKWIPGLKPIVSTLKSKQRQRRSRRPRPRPLSRFDHGKDNLRKRRPKSKPTDRFKRNQKQRFNPMSSSSDFVNIQHFLAASNMPERRKEFRPSNFARAGNRPSHFMILRRSDDGYGDQADAQKGSLKSSYLSLLSDTQAQERNPQAQASFFKPAPQINKKLVNLNFAKTLSKLYNDYKPGGENAAKPSSNSDSSSGSDGSDSNSGPGKDKDNAIDSSDSGDTVVSYSDDDLVDIAPPPPPKYRPRPGNRRPGSYLDRQYSSGRIPPPSYRGPPRGPPPFGSSSLSSLDFMEDDFSSSLPGISSSGFSGSDSPFDSSIDYSDSPMTFSSGGSGYRSGGFSSSSSGPMTVSSYRMRGPPSFDSFDFGPGPESFSGRPRGPPPPSRPSPSPSPPSPPPQPAQVVQPLISPVVPYMNPLAPLLGSGLGSSMLSPSIVLSPGSTSTTTIKKAKVKTKERIIPIPKRKPRFQHHPAVMIRELLTRNQRGPRHHRIREIIEHDDDDDKETEQVVQKPGFSVNIPLTVPAAVPQFSYNPLVNALPGGMNYYGPPPPPPPYYGYPPPPPPPQPTPQQSSLSTAIVNGLSSLARETLSASRNRPIVYYGINPPMPPTPPPSRRPPRPPPSRPSSSEDGENSDGSDSSASSNDKKESSRPQRPPPGPITQHLQDWPRIFTAMGSSVDAVAGGIHAVRKEISKMTGQTIAKGIMMGGTTVHEVSKGMAHMVTKIATI